jgi:D-aminopeptidase
VPAGRHRLRELGHAVGRFPTGTRNAIVDVDGVLVGHETLNEDLADGRAVRTGVTAVLPHGGNLYAEKVLAACHVVNGYGKAAGLTQLVELGTLETPILVTSTLSVGPAWEGALRHLLDRNPDAARDRDTVNPIVMDVFDGYLNDARGLHVRPEHAIAAIESAHGGDVAEGSVGAGTGTTCLGFKGGVGTSSRVTESEPALALGCLVVTNYGSRRDLHLLVEGATGEGPEAAAGGSVIVVLVTDAPLSERQLRRLAARGAAGLARAGSFAPNPSGDYLLAFSTAQRLAHRSGAGFYELRLLRDDGAAMRQLFEMAGEATCEAVLNSLCAADAMVGRDGHRLEAFPYELLEGLRW